MLSHCIVARVHEESLGPVVLLSWRMVHLTFKWRLGLALKLNNVEVRAGLLSDPSRALTAVDDSALRTCLSVLDELWNGLDRVVDLG